MSIKLQLSCLFLTSLATSVLSQYSVDAAMRPDITFDTNNDQFDITSMLQEQNRNNEEYRRSASLELVPAKNSLLEAIKNSKTPINGDFVFAEADNDSAEGGTVTDFENNLQKLKDGGRRNLQGIVARVHNKVLAARSAGPPDPEQEILMNHALPIQLNIRGYLQTPMVE